jgi:hypothetical protein
VAHDTIVFTATDATKESVFMLLPDEVTEEVKYQPRYSPDRLPAFFCMATELQYLP